MIRVTARITRTLAVLAALTLGVLLIAGRPQAPAPDTRPTFAASASAAILGAAEAPTYAPTTPTTLADLPADTRTGIVSAMRAAQPISDSTAVTPVRTPQHPQLLFDAAELRLIRSRAGHPQLKPVADRLLSRANTLLTAKPLLVSTTGRGEIDPSGTLKGLDAATRLQGRALTFAMAFLLSGDRRYRDAAVEQLDDAIVKWPAWVDTAHQPPYDLMTGHMSLTFGLTYDWLHDALSDAERRRLIEGVERRALQPYLNAAGGSEPMWWYTVNHNWNPVCNGGATVLALALALALGADSALSAPAMTRYWDNLGADGGWAEGTGYWAYGHRYAFMAADALRRAGRREGSDYLSRPGARTTGYFPLVFNPGTRLSASFGDGATRVSDPLFYFLGREYRNADFVWAQDRIAARALTSEGLPEEALALIWRPADETWLPEAQPGFRPMIPAVGAFPSIGWSMLASAQPDPPLFLAFKSGSLAANHSHLDLNHVTLGMGNNMLLVDLGSRPYPADYFQRTERARYYEITTAGHNSVLVGGKRQVFDRLGALEGPFEGQNFTAFVGVADGSYEIRTPHARRHVVFVDKRYYVLLDDVVPASPAPIELRFHSYGTIALRPSGGWTVTEGDVALDVVPAQTPEMRGSIEVPSGWIRPVNLLRIASQQPLGQLTLATALIPHLPNRARATLVSQEVRGAELDVTVGADRLVFQRTADGYVLQSVTVPTAPATTGTFITAPSFGAGYLTLVVFNGGSVDQLEAAVRQAGASGAWVQDANGTFSVLIPGGPATLRDAFVRSFPKEFAPMTPVLLVRSTP